MTKEVSGARLGAHREGARWYVAPSWALTREALARVEQRDI